MSELQVTAYCRIHDGRLDQFREAAAACLTSVREKDSGTLQYDWCFNGEQTLCIVHERYRDSDACLEHMVNLGDKLPALVETCDISIEVFGDPSAELMEATAGLPTTVYAFYQGL